MEMDSGMRYDFTKFVKSAQAIPGRNVWHFQSHLAPDADLVEKLRSGAFADVMEHVDDCLLYTSDAADDLLCADLGGRRTIKKKHTRTSVSTTQATR